MKVILTQDIPLFLKPNKVEKLLGISYKTLQDGVSHGTYKKGIHFYIPDGKQFAYWDTQALIKWMTTDSNEDELVNSILDKILRAS